MRPQDIPLNDPSFSVLGKPEFLKPMGLGFFTTPSANASGEESRLYARDPKTPETREIVRSYSELLKNEGGAIPHDHPAILEIAAVMAAELRRHGPNAEEAKEALFEKAAAIWIDAEMVRMAEHARIVPSSRVRAALKRHRASVLRTLDWVSDIQIPTAWEVLASELERGFGLAGFRASQQVIRSNLKTFMMSDRERLVQRHQDDPAYVVTVKPNGAVVVIPKEPLPGNEKPENVLLMHPVFNLALSETPEDFESHFDPDFWKNAIENAPPKKRDAMRTAAANDLLQRLHDFPWNNTGESGQNPADVAASWEMQCVGKAIIGHTYLKALGISHSACMTPNHIALMVFMGTKQWLFEPGNSPAALLANEPEDDSRRRQKSANLKVGGNKPFEYELVDAEEGTYFSMMLNITNYMEVDPSTKIPIFLELIRQQLPNPTMGYYSSVGENYRKAGNVEAAFACASEEARIHPENPWVPELRGRIFSDIGQYEDAYLEFIKRPENSNSKDTKERMATCIEKMGLAPMSNLSEDARKYAKWIRSHRRIGSPQRVAKWPRLDLRNPDAWYFTWLRLNKTPSSIAMEISTMLSNPWEYRHSGTDPIVRDVAAEGIRLLLASDDDGLRKWIDRVFAEEPSEKPE